MWLLVPLAHAGGLALPEGENRADWASALALAGLDGRGERVALASDRSGWWLTPPGSTARVPVHAPTDADAREAIAVLAASLLRRVDTSVALPGLPPILPPPARPGPSRAGSARTEPGPPGGAPPTPAAAPGAPAPPAARIVVEGEVLVPEVLDEVIVLVDPAAARPQPVWRGWFDVGAGIAWREGTRAGPAVQLGGGGALGPARVGLRLDLVSRLEVAALGPDTGFSSANVLGGVWLAPRDSATVGVVGGASGRRLVEAEETSVVLARGVVGAELGGRIATHSIEFLPRFRVTADLARTNQVRDGEEVGALAPMQIAAELGIGPAVRALQE